MPERPPIRARGTIRAARIEGRLYQIEMENGYRALAVVTRHGPPLPPEGERIGRSASVEFSPYDMSRCKITAWH